MGANINGFIDWRGIADGEGLVWNAARNSFLPGAVGGGIATVENGLSLSSGVLKLGGPLTENTSIGGAGFNLEIAGLGNFTLSGTGLGTISANQLAMTGATKGETWTGAYLGSFGGTYGLSASGGLSLTETDSNGVLTLQASGGLGIISLLSNGSIQGSAASQISLESTGSTVTLQASSGVFLTSNAVNGITVSGNNSGAALFINPATSTNNGLVLQGNFNSNAIRISRGMKFSWEDTGSITTCLRPGSANVVDFNLSGNQVGIDLRAASLGLQVQSVNVVGARKTGWSSATGTATRTTFATSTVTTAQLAERVKALIDDLISHGLIGS